MGLFIVLGEAVRMDPKSYAYLVFFIVITKSVGISDFFFVCLISNLSL